MTRTDIARIAKKAKACLEARLPETLDLAFSALFAEFRPEVVLAMLVAADCATPRTVEEEAPGLHQRIVLWMPEVFEWISGALEESGSGAIEFYCDAEEYTHRPLSPDDLWLPLPEVRNVRRRT